MDKYKEYFNKYEGNNKEKIEERKKELSDKFYNYLKKEHGKLLYSKYKELFKDDAVWKTILCFSLLEESIQKWFIENILIYLNKENIFYSYMRILNNNVTREDNRNTRKEYMSSLKKLGLVKDIKFKDDTFTIVLLDDKEIKFTKILKSEQEISVMNSQCHHITYDLIKAMTKKGKKVYCITILEKELYGYTRYHSVLLYDGYIYDYARNIFIKYEDYKYLFNYEEIVKIEGKELLKNINYLEITDKDFNECDYYDVLKYAIHKQINNI